MDGKFCVECGARISIDARFCRACGRRQPEITIPPELLGAPEPVKAETKAVEAAAETSAETVETKSETAEEKAAEAEKAAVFEPDTDAEKPPVQPAPAPAPKPVPDIQSYLNNGEPQPQRVEAIPEPKREGGIHPAYILLIGCVLFAAALLVWAIFATNKLTMTHQTKSRPSSSVSMVKPTEPPATSGRRDKDKSSSSNSRSEYSGVNGKSVEYIESGDYTVGEGIDAGEYIFVAEEISMYGDGESEEDEYIPSFYAGVYEEANEEDPVRTGWYQMSTYMKLEDEQHLHFSWAKAYPVDSYEGENDPFEHAGMFLVGRDVKPGTYSFDLLTDQGYESYTIYDSIDEVMADNGFDGHHYGIDKDDKVELRNGQYIQLEWCRLKK